MNLAKFFNYDLDGGDFRLYDKNGNVIYTEDLNGFWTKEYLDDDGKVIYCEYSDGF